MMRSDHDQNETALVFEQILCDALRKILWRQMKFYLNKNLEA